MSTINVRIAVSSVVLFAFTGLHAYSAWQGFEGAAAVVFAAGNLVGAFALLRRAYWARWFGLGIGTVGLINCVTVAGVLPDALPLIGAQGVAFAALLLLLQGRRMAASFEGRIGWPLDSWRMRLVSWAAVLNVGAVAMLIRGLGAQWSPSCMQAASVAGILLGVSGVALVWQRRTAGLLLLALGALNGLMLSWSAGRAALHAWSWGAEQAGGYLCGTAQLRMVETLVDGATIATALLPAAAGAAIALVALTGPIVGFLRDDR